MSARLHFLSLMLRQQQGKRSQPRSAPLAGLFGDPDGGVHPERSPLDAEADWAELFAQPRRRHS